MSRKTKTSEIKTALEMGRIEKILAIVARLSDLPEFGCQDAQARVRAAAEAARKAEEEAQRLREQMRVEALRLLHSVSNNWSAAEIETATGYKAE